MFARRRFVTFALLACAAFTGLPGATPAGAASVPDPCKVLKAADISKVLGATPAAGVRGARTISATSCSYAVPAGTGRPAGELIVTITFSGAKTTYNGLPGTPATRRSPSAS